MDLVGFMVRGEDTPPIAVFNKLPTYWGADFGRGAVWHNAAAGSLALSFAAEEQENGSYGQFVTWDDPTSEANVTIVDAVDSVGDIHGMHFRYAEVFQSPNDPLDLLFGVAGSAQYYPWNSSMGNDKYMGGIMRSKDGGVSLYHVAAQPRDGVIGGQYSDFGQLSADGGDGNTVWYGNCEGAKQRHWWLRERELSRAFFTNSLPPPPPSPLPLSHPTHA
jgi:hypothetical protein